MLFTEWAWLLRMLHTLARPCVCPEPTGETGPKQILEIGLGAPQLGVQEEREADISVGGGLEGVS